MHATCCNIWNYLVATFSNYWLQIFWNSVQSVKCWCEGGRSRAVAVAKIFWSLFKFFSSLIRPHLHISSYLFSFILMTRRHWRGWWSFGPSWNVDIQLSLSGLRVGKIIWFLSDICCSLFLVYGRAHPADWCQTRWCWLALQRRVVQMVQIANDTLFKGGVQPEYVGCSLHHYAVCGVVRELHCASLCTALCNTARRPAADSAESCDAPFVNIHQQPPSSPMSTTLL